MDFDHGLNAAVNKIRDAVNYFSENPQFIETLPNGYRFKAAVDFGTPAALEVAVPLPDAMERSHECAGRPRAGTIAVPARWFACS